MSQLDKLYIAATGMITPVGFNTEMTVAAVNAGISAYAESDYYNKLNSPMIGAFVPNEALPELDEALQTIGLKADEKRMICMAHVALSEIGEYLPSDGAVPLFLAGPENIPARPSSVTPSLISLIQQQSGMSIDVDTSRYIAVGRAGVIKAIDLAFKYLSVADSNYVLVGGVDSYNNTGLMSYLDVENRVLAKNVSNGFALGEGAGFLLLSKHPDKYFLPVVIHQPGLSQEEGHLYSKVAYRGEGLSNAASQAIQYVGKANVDQLYSSMNGENFFVKELGVLSIRNAKYLNEGYQVNHPADCYGDIGAATGAILIGLSAMNLVGHSQGESHMVCCSSDMAERGVVCVSGVLRGKL